MADSDEARAVALAEVSRQRRVLNMMVSMHSSLRDWDKRLGTGLVCLVLVLSTLGLAFAFAGGGVTITLFGVRAQRSTWLGWLAVMTACLTLIELVLDLRGAARRRADAVEKLSALRMQFRMEPGADVVVEARRRAAAYAEVVASLPEVPNLMFNRLKASHLRKVEISKLLDAQPGISARRARREVKSRRPTTGPVT